MTAPGSSDADQTPKETSRTGWLKAALVVSLAFNLFVIGAIGAHHWWHEGHRHYGRISGPGFAQLLPRPFFAELTDKRRDELRALMHAHRQEFGDARKQMRLAARDIAGALVAEPFDQALFDKALKAFVATGHSFIDLGVGVAGDVVAQLTPDERKKLGGQLMLRTKNGWRLHRDGKPD